MTRSSSKHSRRTRRLHIVITAGPTREFFDSVRFISNPSSGKMGYAIAEAAAARGHQVTLVSGPTALEPPSGVETIQVMTAAEMSTATKRAFREADAGVFCAAVCDYRPAKKSARKMPKETKVKHVELLPTEDIAAAIGRRKGNRITMVFAMEDRQDARTRARRKMERKNADAVVLNGPENVGSDKAGVEILVRKEDWVAWKPASKPAVARRLVTLVERLADKKQP